MVPFVRSGSSVPELRKAELAGCRLSAIPAFVVELKSLEILDLNFNDMQLSLFFFFHSSATASSPTNTSEITLLLTRKPSGSVRRTMCHDERGSEEE